MSNVAVDGLLETLKRAATALKRAGIPFALTGGCAAYARGAAPSPHDVDFLILPEDVETALSAMESVGMSRVEPPEDWLVKAYEDDERTVDLIFRPANREVTLELLDRADELEVEAVLMPVLDATDLVILWVLTFSEHNCDFGPPLFLVRALREQVDWERVVRESARSPYAYAFLVLLDRLDVADLTELIGRPDGTG